MKKLSLIALIFSLILPCLSTAADDSGSSTKDCATITEDQLDAFTKAMEADRPCDDKFELELEPEVETEKELDNWRRDPNDLIPEEKPETSSDEEVDSTEDETESEGRFFGGGIGGLSISAEGLLGSNIYNNSGRHRGRRRTQGSRGGEHDPESNVPQEPVWTNPSGSSDTKEDDSKWESPVSPVWPVPNTRKIQESIISLSRHIETLDKKSLIYKNQIEPILDGDWEVEDALTITAMIAVGGYILYKVYKGVNILNPLIYIFGVSISTASYADFDTQFRLHPEDILSVRDSERFNFLLSDKEIFNNTLKILSFSQKKICDGNNQKGVEFCTKANLLFN